MSIRWEGLDELRDKLTKARKDAVKDLGRALFVEGNRIMTVSKRDFVPVDQGTLRGSGHVRQPHIRGTRAEVTLGYGGAASAYALVQHERLDYAHDVGQAKYLERPVNDAARGFGERLGRHLELFE